MEQTHVPYDARTESGDGNRLVLALGEATGHAHVVDGARGHASLRATGERRFLIVSSTVELTHEEHAPIEIQPGAYEIRIQREHVPTEERTPWERDAWRRVVD